MLGKLLNGRYRLDAELGQGGMGVVYQAHDSLLDREVAVKCLNELNRTRLGTQGRARLLHEAQSTARLNHPNIVSIYDAGEADGIPFIVMELLEGESLYEKKPRQLNEIISIAKQICAGLEHAHRFGIIHRDLKPENIIVEHNGGVTLTDFGLARSLSSRLTDEGVIVGTVFYMAPEIALRHEIDARADLYSLGVILYELLTGCLPFTADDPLAVISQHLYAPVVPPHVHRPDIPSPLDELTVQLLSKQPEDRPQSASEVLKVLEILEQVELLDSAITPGTYPALDRVVRGRLVGRERELGEINTIWKQSLAGTGHTLLVSGEAGIGKTRLVRELTAQATVSGNFILSGACYAEGGVPYSPFPQMIKESLVTRVSDLSLPDYVLASLSTIVPELDARFPDVSLKLPVDPRTEQQRVLESIAAWCTALTARAPVLLFIDDIHWADSDALFVLRHLSRQAPGLRLLIATTYREVEMNEASPFQNFLLDLTRERLATRLKLTRFTREQTKDMLSVLLTPQGKVQSDLLDAVFQETEGNPFFIEEVVKTLVEEGKLEFNDGLWAAQKKVELEIPQSVRLTIQSRLARLPEPTQEVLRMAALIGRQFEFAVLQAAIDIEEDHLIDALEIAERAQIITESQAVKGEGLKFNFAHALIPTTLRESISGLRKQRMHRRLAKAITQTRTVGEVCVERLAYHFEQAGEIEQAILHYLESGDCALKVYANQEAERFYRTALELSTRGERPSEVLAGLGEALFRQSRFEEAIAAWGEEIELCRQAGDYENLARLYSRSARAAWYTGNPGWGLELCREGMQALEAMGKTPGKITSYGMAALLHETARALHFNDLAEEALDLCRQALEMCTQLEILDVHADTLATYGILTNISPQEARQVLLEAVELAENHHLWAIALRAHTNLGENYRNAGEMRLAKQEFERCVELARKMGIKTWEHDQLASVAEICLDLGEFQRVEEIFRDTAQLLTDQNTPNYFRILIQIHKSRLYRYQGKFAESLELIDDCLAKVANQNIRWLIPYLLVLKAENQIEQGQSAAAEETLAPIISLNDEKFYFEIVTAYALLGKQSLLSENVIEAREFARKAREVPCPCPRPLVEAVICILEAQVAAAEGNWPEASAIFEEVLQFSQENGMRWQEATIFEARGQAYLHRGQDYLEQAADNFQRARAIFDQISLPFHAARMEAILNHIKP